MKLFQECARYVIPANMTRSTNVGRHVRAHAISSALRWSTIRLQVMEQVSERLSIASRISRHAGTRRCQLYRRERVKLNDSALDKFILLEIDDLIRAKQPDGKLTMTIVTGGILVLRY